MGREYTSGAPPASADKLFSPGANTSRINPAYALQSFSDRTPPTSAECSHQSPETTMGRPLFVLFLLTVISTAAPVRAELYKWVGSDGRVRYADRPPEGSTKAQTFKVPNEVPPTIDSSPEAELRRQEYKERQAKSQAAQQEKRARALDDQRQAERQKAQCDRALLGYKKATDMPAVSIPDRFGGSNNFADRNERIVSAKIAAQSACQGVYSGY
jgi:hypothetical protein